MPLLSIQGLSVEYNTGGGLLHAVDRVSLDVNRGEAVGLVGESGCGKTSLASALIRLLPDNANPLGGKVLLDGVDLVPLSPEEMRRNRWRRISMVFQAAMSSFSPVHTVRDQVVEAIQAHELVAYREAADRVSRLFTLVDLEPSIADRFPHQLSGGMRQRAVIAMALACNPDFVIADEPTTALDVIVQQKVLVALRDAQNAKGLGMLVISHDLGVIAQLCGRIAVMYAGRIVEVAEPEALFRTPRHPYSKALVESLPSIHGKKRAMTSLAGEPPDLTKPVVGCAFAPRCASAMDDCRTDAPALEVHNGRQFACWHPVE